MVQSGFPGSLHLLHIVLWVKGTLGEVLFLLSQVPGEKTVHIKQLTSNRLQRVNWVQFWGPEGSCPAVRLVMPFRGPGTVSLLTFELWYRSHVAVLADISQEATWGIYGCKSKFPKPHGGLMWPLLSWASRGCSGQCHESWAPLAGWEAPSPRAHLKMLPVEKNSRRGTRWKEKGHPLNHPLRSLWITMKF